jgi:hypothetical protein
MLFRGAMAMLNVAGKCITCGRVTLASSFDVVTQRYLLQCPICKIAFVVGAGDPSLLTMPFVYVTEKTCEDIELAKEEPKEETWRDRAIRDPIF